MARLHEHALIRIIVQTPRMQHRYKYTIVDRRTNSHNPFVARFVPVMDPAAEWHWKLGGRAAGDWKGQQVKGLMAWV